MQVNAWSYDEAEEWIEYNTERALPYYGEKAPVLLDCSYIKSNNKKYVSLKISS